MATMAFGRIWWKTRPSKAKNLKTEYPNKGGHFLPECRKGHGKHMIKLREEKLSGTGGPLRKREKK